MVEEEQEPGDGAGMSITQTSSRVKMLKQPEHMANIRRPECIVRRWCKRHTEDGGGKPEEGKRRKNTIEEEIGRYVHWHPHKP